jgi:hypothetical protein
METNLLYLLNPNPGKNDWSFSLAWPAATSSATPRWIHGATLNVAMTGK